MMLQNKGSKFQGYQLLVGIVFTKHQVPCWSSGTLDAGPVVLREVQRVFTEMPTRSSCSWRSNSVILPAMVGYSKQKSPLWEYIGWVGWVGWLLFVGGLK